MSTQAPAFVPADIPKRAKVAIVAARFNEVFVEELLSGCTKRLAELGIGKSRTAVYRVPGAFELPVAAKALAHTGKYDAIICLGCVIRGETPHFEYVAGEAARGIQQVAIAERLPVIFGVLTTNNEKQVRDRLGGKHGHAGRRAAEAAAEMIVTLKQIKD